VFQYDEKQKQLDKELLQVQQDFKRLENKYDQSDKDFQQLQVKHSSMEHEKSQLTSELNKISDRLLDEQTDRRALEVSLEGYRQRYSLLSVRFEKIRDSADERDVLEREKEEIARKLEDVEELIRGYRLQIQQLQSELADTKSTAKISKELLKEKYERRIAILDAEIQEKDTKVEDAHQQIERMKETNKEFLKRLEKNDTGSNSDRHMLRNIDRKLREAQNKIDDLNKELLNALLEIKRVEDKAHIEKSKFDRTSFEKIDLESKVRHLEKELWRLSHPKNSPSVQTTPLNDQHSEVNSDNPSDE